MSDRYGITGKVFWEDEPVEPVKTDAIEKVIKFVKDRYGIAAIEALCELAEAELEAIKGRMG
jgi:hypothetical protein